MSRLDKIKNEINNRGIANGWHAQELQRRAQSQNMKMNVLFMNDINGESAFNVPAELTSLTTKSAVYTFLDGSCVTLLPPNRVFKKD